MLHVPTTISPTSGHLGASAPFRARCVRIVQETHDVRSFLLAVPGRRIAFRAGQYVIVHAAVGAGEAHSRCYSISSSPTYPEALSITVKRVPGGLVSTWLHEEVRAGDELVVSGPAGNFTLPEKVPTKILMLSAGSGITPVMSMLRWLTDTGQDVDVHFVHNARSPRDLIFFDELRALDATHSWLTLSLMCEQAEGESWYGYKGRLNAGALAQMVPDLAERTVYLCGPEGYMRAAWAALQCLGVPPQRCREESFGGGHEAMGALVPLTANDPDPPAGRAAASVTFSASGMTVECRAGETVLDVALRAGIWVPHACRMGICGTCKTRKIAGEVASTDLGGLSDEEKRDGYLLACCSRPQGEVVIEA